MPRGKYAENYRDIIGTVAGVPLPMPGRKPAPKGIRDAAIDEFLSTLRGLVNQWIDSGRLRVEANGEHPLDRSITTPVPGYAETLEIRLQRFFAMYPPHIVSGPTSASEFFASFAPIYFSSWESLPNKSSDDLLERARDYAMFQFVRLLDSPGRYRIFRCDKCGQYFAKQRTPKREGIQRGTFCPKHKAQGARLRMEELRKRKREILFDTAAKAWAGWLREHRLGTEGSPPQLKAVAARVNKKHETSFRRNWVSTNLKEILARVEAQGNGKTER